MGSDVDGAVRDQLESLLATAMALTGSAAAASALVGEVVVRARDRRVSVDLDDPGPGLRNLLVQRFVATRDPKMAAADDIDDAGGLSDRLVRLSRVQRAIAVLAWRDRLTHAEIAGILDRPVATVSRQLDEAHTGLGAEPYEVAAVLDQLAWSAPEPTTVRAEATAYGRRRRAGRRRVAGLTTVLVAVVALGLTVPTLIVPRLFPTYARTAGDWVYSFDLVLPPGYRIAYRYLTSDTDAAFVVRDGDREGGCSVAVGVAGDVVVPTERRVDVNGRRGYWGTSEDGEVQLRWARGKATAAVTCDNGLPSEAQMLELARLVRFRESALLLPFRLDSLPVGLQVSAVGTSRLGGPAEDDATTGLALGPADQDAGSADGDGDDQVYFEVPHARPEGDDVRSVRVGAVEALLTSEGDQYTLCLPSGEAYGCFFTWNGDGSGRGQVRRLMDLASRTTLTADLDDRSTWWNARDAMPH
ncbi:MAG TPA: hypothetical protein VIT20_07255 [Propionibacteriaceae bacterium]